MGNKKNIRLVLAYDGTDFAGWQVQPAQRTVQGVVQEGLSRMHKHPVTVTASGRTDSGVHAAGQVINFFSDIRSIEPANFAEAVNSFLPKDVKVVRSDLVEDDFHARYAAQARSYRYYLLPAPVTLPWQERYCMRLRKLPDIETLSRMASCFIGSHDFSAFSSPDEERRTTIRNINSAIFFMEREYLVFHITGNAFLWKMVRTMVGTLLELESSGREESEVKRILDSRRRNEAGPTAPPWGLFLYRVRY
jgi:tRNA pseudouridine38-40 synthase